MKSWQKTEKERLWKDRKDWRLFIHQPAQNRNDARRGRKTKCEHSLPELCEYVSRAG
jgi:hypothetical protein